MPHPYSLDTYCSYPARAGSFLPGAPVLCLRPPWLLGPCMGQAEYAGELVFLTVREGKYPGSRLADRATLNHALQEPQGPPARVSLNCHQLGPDAMQWALFSRLNRTQQDWERAPNPPCRSTTVLPRSETLLMFLQSPSQTRAKGSHVNPATQTLLS